LHLIVSRLWLAAVGFALAYFAQGTVRWLHHGYKLRKTVRDMQAKGAPTLPHSWIFGHLIFMGEFRKDHPEDANIYNMQSWFMDNLERFFPGEETIPPVIYLDLWPLIHNPMLMTTHPAVSAQYTQLKSMPKSRTSIDYLTPLTGNKDIVSVEGEEWKHWRSRLNPVRSQHARRLVPCSTFTDCLVGFQSS
jgi:hypothetical protein